MKKVGLLTIHGVYNYGAMLQAYSLQRYLSDLGTNTEIIDYRPYALYRPYGLYFRTLTENPKRFLKSIYTFLFLGRKFSKFKEFDKKYLKKSSRSYQSCSQMKELDYDLVISGSDQIWNPFITSFDEAFLLPFDKVQRRCAYSSSIGVASVSKDWLNIMEARLQFFDVVAVREKTGCDLIRSICPNINPCNVLDPVFLHDAKYWRDFGGNDLTPKEDYILIYSLEVNDELSSSAILLAKKHKLKIVAIHPFSVQLEGVDIEITNAGPREFTSLIDNARYIVSNSFHGVAFSIIFEKKLVCFPHSATGSRILDLMGKLGLNNGSNNINVGEINVVDTSLARDNLSENVKYSKSVLVDVLG